MSLPVLKESKHLLMESRPTLQFHWKLNRAWEEQREVVSEMTEKQINILVNTAPQVFRVLSSGTFQGGIAQRLSLYPFCGTLYSYVLCKARQETRAWMCTHCCTMNSFLVCKFYICSEMGPIHNTSTIGFHRGVVSMRVSLPKLQLWCPVSMKQFPSRFNQSKRDL